MTLDDIAVFQVLAMAPAITLLPFVYHHRQQWWTDQYGRAFMALAVGLMLLVNFAVTFQFVPAFPGKAEIKFGVYTLLILTFYWLVWLMWRTPRGRD